ncbi:Mce/MlaD family protein [Jatrophihabitans fulvus]
MSDESAPPRPHLRRRSAVLGVVVAVVLATAAGLWWWREHRTGIAFTARFSAAVGVYAGSDVRVLGVPVGEVDSVVPHPTYVSVAMHLDPGVRVRADTYAVVIAPNLVSDRFVQLTGAWASPASGPTLRDGAVIGPARTRTPVELDELNRNLTRLATALGPDGANSGGALSRLLRTGAANLDGTGRTLNATIRRLARSGRTLDSAKDDIFATVEQLATFTSTLRRRNDELASANRTFASVSGTLADDRQSFALAIRELGTALGLVQRFVRDNRAALSTNVDRLAGVARALGEQRTSLAKALRSAPVLVQNFLAAYDGDGNLLRGRANLNELTVWARGGAAAPSTAAPSSAATARSGAPAVSGSPGVSVPGGPPLLLPRANATQVSR